MEAKAEEEGNGYFRSTDSSQKTSEGQVIYPLVQDIGKRGLHDGYVSCSFDGDGFLDEFYFRKFFVRNFSWFVPNKKWVQSFSTYLIENKIHTVLEVAAGTGYGGAVLSKWMDEHHPSWDLNWICTDVEPPLQKVFQEVKPLGSEGAVEQLAAKADLLFFAWWPYEGDSGDLVATKAFTDLGKPVIVVGEDWGGCTGSKDFWQEVTGRTRYSDEESEVSALTIDYLYWELFSFNGINDCTYVITKRSTDAA